MQPLENPQFLNGRVKFCLKRREKIDNVIQKLSGAAGNRTQSSKCQAGRTTNDPTAPFEFWLTLPRAACPLESSGLHGVFFVLATCCGVTRPLAIFS